MRDEGLLISALERPKNHWHYDADEDAVSLAVTLLFAIARNHPFAQGNKRTGFEAALIFLENNGYAFVGPDDHILADAIVAVIEGTRTEQEFEVVFRAFVTPVETDATPVTEGDPE